jgi:hypothetical protein
MISWCRQPASRRDGTSTPGAAIRASLFVLYFPHFWAHLGTSDGTNIDFTSWHAGLLAAGDVHKQGVRVPARLAGTTCAVPSSCLVARRLRQVRDSGLLNFSMAECCERTEACL